MDTSPWLPLPMSTSNLNVLASRMLIVLSPISIPSKLRRSHKQLVNLLIRQAQGLGNCGHQGPVAAHIGGRSPVDLRGPASRVVSDARNGQVCRVEQAGGEQRTLGLAHR